jgi:hypothetical protein
MEPVRKQYAVRLPDPKFSPLIITRTIEPTYVEIDALTVQKMAFHSIAYPSGEYAIPYWQTELGQIHINFIRQTLGEFIRRRFNKDFKNSALNFKFRQRKPEDIKEAKALVRAESTLWLAVWRVLSDMYVHGGHHPAFILHRLLQEPGGLVAPMFCLIPQDGMESEGATSVIKNIQSENRKLGSATPNNPFNRKIQPITYTFVEAAIALCHQSEQGRKDWMEIVRARMAIVTLLKEQGARLVEEDGAIKTAGRPSASKRSIPNAVRLHEESLNRLLTKGFKFYIP